MLKFAGKDLEEFGVVALGRGTYGAPERDVEQIHVPGRNGDLLYAAGGFKNLDITYPCSITENQQENSRKLRNWLLSHPGYAVLEDDYDTDHIRHAEYRGPYAPDVHTARDNSSANFDLVFNCKPQRWRRDGALFLGMPHCTDKEVTWGRNGVPADVTITVKYSTGVPSTYTATAATSISGTAKDVTADVISDAAARTLTYTGVIHYYKITADGQPSVITVTVDGESHIYSASTTYGDSMHRTCRGIVIRNTSDYPCYPDIRLTTYGPLPEGGTITLTWYTSSIDYQTITMRYPYAGGTGGLNAHTIWGEASSVSMACRMTATVSGRLKAIPAGSVGVLQLATTATDLRMIAEIATHTWDL